MIHELRTYHAAPGKRDALFERFKTTTLPLFARHGFTVTGFWESRADSGVFVYLCAFDDDAARERAWNAFNTDPAWLTAKMESEADGPLSTSITTLVLDPVTAIATQ